MPVQPCLQGTLPIAEHVTQIGVFGSHREQIDVVDDEQAIFQAVSQDVE
jgi:hypothetical protein